MKEVIKIEFDKEGVYLHVKESDNSKPMLEKAINQKVPDNSLLSGRPTASEMACCLASEIYGKKHEKTFSVEFSFIKGDYSFCCDVRVMDHGQRIECSCPMTFFDGNEIESEPGILYELEYETKKLL